MSKLGASVTPGPRNGYGIYCESKPAVVIAVDEGGALLEAKQRNAITIFRDTSVYVEAPVEFNQTDDMVGLARNYYPRLKQKWLQNTADYYCVTNEIGGNDIISIRKLIRYEKEIMRLANHDGIKLCVLNLAGGSPGNFEVWKTEHAPFITEAWEAGNIYGRHAYGDGDLVVNGQVVQGNPSRPLEEIAYLNSIGRSGGIALTEIGLDAGFGFAGVPRFSSQMIAYEQIIRNIPEFIGMCCWTLGRWEEANWQDAIPTLAQYNIDNPTPVWLPPAKKRGDPRIQYRREYWVVPGNILLSKYLEVCTLAFPNKRTVGFSYDDSAIGNLEQKHAIIFGQEHPQDALLNWYKQNYPGTTVEFRPNYETDPQAISQTGLRNDGRPRLQYHRIYHRVDDRASLGQYLEVCKAAYNTKGTVGFSADDACLGNLDRRTFNEYGNQYSKDGLTQFVNSYYPGVTLIFNPLPEPEIELTAPLTGQFVITSRFNAPRDYDGDGVYDDLHEGVDFAPLDSTSYVLASENGVVERVRESAGYGKYVVVRHGGGRYFTWYAHMQTITVVEGQGVNQKQRLGIVGNSGYSTGRHLHLNLQIPEHGLAGYVVPDVVNPEPYIDMTTIPNQGAYSGPPITEFIRGVDQPASDWYWPSGKLVFDVTGLSPKFHTNGVNPNWYSEYKSEQFNIVRILLNPAFSGNAQAIFNETKEEYRKFYNLGCFNAILLNEPNIEGMGIRWNNGTEFGIVFRQLCQLYKQEFPNIKLWFPGCSPGFGAQHTFINAAKVVGAFDFIYGVVEHVYTGLVNDEAAAVNQMYDEVLDFQQRHTLAKPLVIGEFSVNRPATAVYKARVYRMFYNKLESTPGLQAAYSFTSTWHDNPDVNQEGWLENRIDVEYASL